MSNFNDALGLMTTEFEKLVSTKTVIGEPYVVGEVTLIPVISVACGIGGGGGEGTAGKEGKGADGSGLGIGGGFRITPVAVITIKGETVSMLPISKKSGMFDKLADMLPGLAEKFANRVKSGSGSTDDECETCGEEAK